MAVDRFDIDVGQGIQSAPGVWYRTIQLLGRGGNSDTYLVSASEGPFQGVLFALKVFRKLSAPDRRDRFLREITFLSQCKHPAVMPVFDSGVYLIKAKESLEYPFVVAEYLPSTLRAVIRARQASIAEKLTYSLQLLSAIRHLAQMTPSVIHRDIKPENIFVKGRSCLLGDFGLMKVQDGSDELDKQIFKDSALPGMPFYYRTPDLIDYVNGQTPLTPKSDVFQLGLVLSELFTNRNPAIPPKDPLEPLELGDIGHIPGELGAGIYSLLRRMLIVNSGDRPDAASLLNPWQKIFEDAVQKAHKLEGRVF